MPKGLYATVLDATPSATSGETSLSGNGDNGASNIACQTDSTCKVRYALVAYNQCGKAFLFAISIANQTSDTTSVEDYLSYIKETLVPFLALETINFSSQKEMQIDLSTLGTLAKKTQQQFFRKFGATLPKMDMGLTFTCNTIAGIGGQMGCVGFTIGNASFYTQEGSQTGGQAAAIGKPTELPKPFSTHINNNSSLSCHLPCIQCTTIVQPTPPAFQMHTQQPSLAPCTTLAVLGLLAMSMGGASLSFININGAASLKLAGIALSATAATTLAWVVFGLGVGLLIAGSLCYAEQHHQILSHCCSFIRSWPRQEQHARVTDDFSQSPH